MRTKTTKNLNVEEFFKRYILIISWLLIALGVICFLLASAVFINNPIWSNLFFAVGGSLFAMGLIDLIFRSLIYQTLQSKTIDNIILKTVGAVSPGINYFLKSLRVNIVINALDREAEIEWEEVGQNLGDRVIKGRKRDFETYSEQNNFTILRADYNINKKLIICHPEKDSIQFKRHIINPNTNEKIYNKWEWDYSFDLNQGKTITIKEKIKYGPIRDEDDYYIHIKNPIRRIHLQIEIKNGYFDYVKKKVYDNSDPGETDIITDPIEENEKIVSGRKIGQSVVWEGSVIKFDRFLGFEYKLVEDSSQD